MTSKRDNLATRRPAETATPVAMGIGYLIALAVGQQDNAQFILAVAGIVAFVPAAVTWAVNARRP